MRQPVLSAALFVLSSTLATTSVQAAAVNTGGGLGAYHGEFCPRLTKKLKQAQFDYRCTLSQGSRENIKRVTNTPRELAFSQLDVFASENVMHGGQDLFSAIRSDIARECLFLVTKNKDFTNFGEISSVASELRFILSPKQSGNTGTFEFLQRIDPDGLGRARNVTYASNTDQALDDVLASADPLAVTMFVEFPDPNNARFKKVIAGGGYFLPVIDRNILRQEIAGQKIYFAQDTEIANPDWGKKGVTVVTACTPMVLFTGAPERLPEGKDRQDHEDLIRTVKAIPVDDLRPQAGFFSKLWKSTKSLSAEGLEKMLLTTEKAREQAGPMMEKAKDMSRQALDKAGEVTKQVQETAKPVMDQAKEMGRKAMEKAGELTDKAAEGAKEMTK